MKRVTYGRVQFDHRAPDVEYGIEETEKVEAVTEDGIVDYHQDDKKQSEDELVKNEKLLNNLPSKTVCEHLDNLHLQYLYLVTF